ncbi:membrane protease catalytic subunit [Trifolium pratense]|uniref:Membrane protease catalytic subunit n=1 Tax=Trifolium pratense TaxID=57577 RepID=A0A2K3MS04_TRIPR|nr:membrane protease catalytic subunit [Trifolium pratense]
MSIVPLEDGSLGRTSFTLGIEKIIGTRGYYTTSLVTGLVERAFEKLILGLPYTSDGVTGDLKVTTKTAKKMISMLGLGPTFPPVATKELAGGGLFDDLVDKKINQDILALVEEAALEADDVMKDNVKTMVIKWVLSSNVVGVDVREEIISLDIASSVALIASGILNLMETYDLSFKTIITLSGV